MHLKTAYLLSCFLKRVDDVIYLAFTSVWNVNIEYYWVYTVDWDPRRAVLNIVL